MTRRFELLDRAEGDKDLQAAIRDLCSRDPIYWINNWVYTYDPRSEDNPYMPFVLFPHQEELIRWMMEREKTRTSGLIEKSRDTGVTWLMCAYLVHRLIFRYGFAGTIGSRKEEEVDKAGNPKCIFRKLEIILERTPSWMIGEGFNLSKNRRERFIDNPEILSSITGEVGDQMGRGGRSTIFILDEFAFVERAQQVDRAVSNNSDVRIYLSTPNGPDNQFAQRRRSGNIPVFRFHWKDDPRKSFWQIKKNEEVLKTGFFEPHPDDVNESVSVVYPWYEKMKMEYEFDPVGLAQEIDIDYSSSVTGSLIQYSWIEAAVDLHNKLPHLFHDYVPNDSEIRGGYDVASVGKNRNVAMVRRGSILRREDIFDWSGTGLYTNAQMSMAFFNRSRCPSVSVDADGVGASIISHWEKYRQGCKFDFVGVNGNSPASKTKWAEKIRSLDFLSNSRAEMYWFLRERFRKTYETVMGYGTYHPSELISIPNHGDLIGQLQSIRYEKRSDGRYIIESKDKMKERGVRSVDFADSLAETCVPYQEIVRSNMVEHPSFDTW